MSQEQDRTDGTSKVKVTILASEWGSSKGGLSTINRELAIQLAKCPEVEITFFLPQCSEEDKKAAVKHSIKIVEATRLAGYEKLEWVSSPPEDLQIDIVVGHGVILGRQAQVIKKIKKCKWVQVVHTDPEELSMFKDYSEPISKGEEKHKIEVELCEMADQVVAVGPKLSEAFRSYLRGCQKHENVLDFTPGVLEEFVSIKQVPDEGKICRVLVFGRGDAEDFALKGFDIAGKAVAALSDTHLVFVGAPDGKQEEIKNRLTGSGVPASRLRVRSYVQNRESLKRLFQEADLVLMPSRTEGFGLTGLEALSAGLPVLVSQNSGFGETLSNLQFGSSYVIDSEDPKDWAAAIKKIWDKDRKMRLQEAELLRDSYQKKYNWTKQIKDLLNKMISMVHADSSDGQSSKQTKSGMLPSASQDSQRIEDMTEHHTDKSIFSDIQEMKSDADKVHNKTNLSVDLKKIASDKGFIISDNRASGNCMFYALSEQLQNVRGIRIIHKELRRILVQFLMDNANLRDGTPLFNFVCGYPSWPKYLEGMAKDGTWGDNLVLCAAANCFQTLIRIISSIGRDFVISSDGPVAHTNPLVLGHVHEEHYVSLQPRQDSSYSYQISTQRKRKNNEESIMRHLDSETKVRKTGDNFMESRAAVQIKPGVPSDKELTDLAGSITKVWTKLGRHLDIKDDKLDEIDVSEKRDAPFKMLRHWKTTNTSKATYHVLHEALCHLGRHDLAEQLCCQLVEEMLKERKKDEGSTEEKRRKMEDNCEQMRSEMENMSGKMDTFIKVAEEKKNEDNCEQMRSEMENMSGKMDTFIKVAEEKKNEDNLGVKLEQMKSALEENIKGTFMQMKSGMEDNIRGTLEQMKDILTASAAENVDKEKGRDDLEKMKSELLGNISKQLDTLYTGMLDNIRDKFEKMGRTIATKIKNEGDFDPTERINQIRQLYTRKLGWLAPFPWCESFYFHLEDIFTRLIMVSKEKKARGTATSKIVEMSAIFQQHEECTEPKKVLIEGKPGMGKTTYCNKVAYDWATNKDEAGDSFPNFQVVLLLKCRDIDIKSDLWKAIDDQLLPRDIQEQERKEFFEFIRHKQSNVLLVLDGLDELPSRKLPESVSEIIQGRVLPDCHLVVTARHEAGIPVRKVCDTLLEIEGFTQKDAERFVFNYFKGKENLAKKLVHKLKEDKNLQEMMANPLNTALLCLLCEDFKGIFPESRTQVYLDMIQCVLRRYRKKKGLSVNDENLIEIYNAELKHLGSIALNGLSEDNMNFEEKQLGNHTSDLPGFGFLSVQLGSSKRRPSLNYAFLHKSFQELFAAYFLCCELLSKEISPESLAGDVRYYRELKQVLLFTCGMLAVQSEETADALIESITNQVNMEINCFPVALECIKECKKEQSEFYVQLARTFGSRLKVHSVDLTDQKIGDGNAAVLALALEKNTTLTELNLSGNNLGADAANALVTVLETNTTLTELRLSGNNLGASSAHGANKLATALTTNTTLTVLDLASNNLGAEAVNAFATALETNTTLTELLLSGNHLGAYSGHGANKLATALTTNTTLTVLDLCQNNLAAVFADALATALETNTTMTALDLSENKFGAAGANVLAPVLKNTNLTKLDLSENNLGDDGANVLASALETNTTLTELYLSTNKIGVAGANALATLLKTNTTLTVLYLSRNKLDAAAAKALATALETNTTLKVLNLFCNFIRDDGAKALATALKSNRALTILFLSDNNLGDAGGALLADGINANSTLTRLELVDNNISDPVVIDKLREACRDRVQLKLSDE